jgi:hypothetical protein
MMKGEQTMSTTSNGANKKSVFAERLYKLCLKRKEIEEEEKDIRFELGKIMKEEEYLKFGVKGGKYRVMNEKTETRVLHDNAFIAKNIGKEKFLSIATVPIGALTKVVGKEEIDKFVHRIDTSYRVVVRFEKDEEGA